MFPPKRRFLAPQNSVFGRVFLQSPGGAVAPVFRGPGEPIWAFVTGPGPGQVTMLVTAPPGFLGDGPVAGDLAGSVTAYEASINNGPRESLGASLPIQAIFSGLAEGALVNARVRALGYEGRTGAWGFASTVALQGGPLAGPSTPYASFPSLAPGDVAVSIIAPPSSYGDGSVRGDGAGSLSAYWISIDGVLTEYATAALPITCISSGHPQGVQVPVEWWAIGSGERVGLVGSALVYPAVPAAETIWGLTDAISGYGLYDAVSGAGLYTEVPPAALGPEAMRVASIGTHRVIASGHSLTDVWAFSGTWPGWWARIRDSVFGVGVGGNRKHTVAGSSLDWRWNNRNTGGDPDTEADSRTGISNFDLLVITEAGAPPRVRLEASRAASASSLNFFYNFVENAYLNGNGGAGAETMLHTINTYVGGVAPWGKGFRDSLVEYEEIFHFMADHAAARMRREHPEVGPDYFIPILPFHRFWIEVWDDIQTDDLPTVTTLTDLFLPADDIHPNATAGYGLACLAFAVIYQQNPATTSGFYVPPGYDTGLRDYFWELSWRLATTYQRAGLGGSFVGEPGYVHGVDIDPTATPVSVGTAPSISPTGGEIGTVYTLTPAVWTGTAPITSSFTLTLGGVDVTSSIVNTAGVLTYTATAEGTLELTCTADNLAFTEAESVSTALVGEILPADALLVVSPDAMTGVAFSPALPAASGGFRTLGGTGRTAVLGATAQYCIAVVRVDTTGLPADFQPILTIHSATTATDFWTTDSMWWSFNGFTVTHGSRIDVVPEGAVSHSFGALADETWHIFEWFGSGTSHSVSIDGTATPLTSPAAMTGLNRISLYAGGGAAPDLDVAAVLVMNRLLNTEELAAIRAWASSIRSSLT